MTIPNVFFKNGSWTGEIELDLWNDFYENNFLLELIVGGESDVKEIEYRHMAAFEYLISNQKVVLEQILSELLIRYPAMQEEYGYEDDEIDEYMPNVSSILEFKELLIPKRIFILDIENDGISYVGFQFTCSWDEEHDFGVMLHKNRIVAMGGSDNAFLSWIAEKDKKL